MTQKTPFKTLVSAGLLLAVVGPASAQIKASGGGYLLRYKFTQGSVAKYKSDTSISMSAGAAPFTLSMPFSIKTKAVTKGIATLEYTVQMPNMGQGAGGPRSTTLKVDNQGVPVGAGSLPGSSMLTFPRGPVKVGSTWTGSMNSGGGAMPMMLNAKYTFLGMKSVGGKQLAAIKVTAIANGTGAQKTSVTGSGTAYLNPADGMMHSMDLKMKVTIQMEGGKPIVSNTTTTMSREK